MHLFGADYAGRTTPTCGRPSSGAIALEWLDEQGGLTRAAGDRIRDELLVPRRGGRPARRLGTITGRAPSVEPLLRGAGCWPAAR